MRSKETQLTHIQDYKSVHFIISKKRNIQFTFSNNTTLITVISNHWNQFYMWLINVNCYLFLYPELYKLPLVFCDLKINKVYHQVTNLKVNFTPYQKRNFIFRATFIRFFDNILEFKRLKSTRFYFMSELLTTYVIILLGNHLLFSISLKA